MRYSRSPALLWRIWLFYTSLALYLLALFPLL